jgi:hypothetical protein
MNLLLRNVSYVQPAPGLDADGNPVACCEHVVMSEHDAICAMRFYYNTTRPGNPLTPEQLLDEFMILHWAAYEKTEESK